jgi:hypothetical protein
MPELIFTSLTLYYYKFLSSLFSSREFSSFEILKDINALRNFGISYTGPIFDPEFEDVVSHEP